MNIEDLIQLINNRLREFKLSRDYARMSGDLERMNAADKEIITLEDTLFKLNLLIDTSKSAAVKEDILAEVITDGSVAVLGEYNITSYATDPLHEEKIMNILSKMGVMDTAEKIDDYIKDKYLSSPVTGEMVMSAASAYNVDARLMMAIMEQDSSFGTAGKAVRTLNPGNVGNNDAGDTVTYESWQEGVTAVAGWLSRHRGSTIISEIPDTLTSTLEIVTSTPEILPVTTSTPPIIIPTTTTTTSIVTSTPASPPVDVPTSTPETILVTTSTPPIITPTTTTTSSIVTSTPAITPVDVPTSTPETIPVTTSTAPIIITPTTTTTTSIITSTPATTTPTPSTVVSQPEAGPPLVETPEVVPVTTSTTTTNTTTSTE